MLHRNEEYLSKLWWGTGEKAQKGYGSLTRFRPQKKLEYRLSNQAFSSIHGIHAAQPLTTLSDRSSVSDCPFATPPGGTLPPCIRPLMKRIHLSAAHLFY